MRPNTLIEILSVIMGYVVGLLLHVLMETIWEVKFCKGNKLRNNENTIIREMSSDIHRDNMPYVIRLVPDELIANIEGNRNIIRDKYYEAYYYVCDICQHGNDIHTIERQIAFMRAMIFPIFLGAIIIGYHFGEYICCSMGIGIGIGIGIVIGGVLCLCVKAFISKKQRKVYQLVWEDYEYLKRLYTDDKDNSQQDKNVLNKK